MNECFNVMDFGATGDGATLDTAAIQAAIDAAAEKGGRVLVPAGVYRIGTVHLKSRVTLDLRQGSKLFGSANLEDYSTQSWGHHKDRTPWHLIFAKDQHHVVITGEGEIDGNGHTFWEPDRPHEWAFWREKDYRPSPMVEIQDCTDVRIENIRLTGTPGWTLHLHDCERAVIHAITIENTRFGPNSDGIDLTGCSHVMISDCWIATGDDAIALKTTEDSKVSEYVTVTNCVLESSCAALRIGYECDQDFRYITFSNCVIRNCSRAVDLLSFTGKSIEHVSITNIVGQCNSGWILDRPIEIHICEADTIYPVMQKEHPNFGVEKPCTTHGAIRDVTITNCDFLTCGRVMIGADEGCVLENVSIDHLRLRLPMIDDPTEIGPKAGGSIGFFRNMAEMRGAPAAVVAENVDNLRVRNLEVHWPTYPVDPEQVTLLRSDQAKANPRYYVDEREKTIAGTNAPAFHAFWGKQLRGGLLEVDGLRASASGTDAIHLEEATIRVVE